jgi:tetratricopeptide (TPR) repeat protein
MGRVLNTLGWIHHDLQDHERAVALCRRCLEVTAARDPEVAGNARLNIADALVALGRIDEAEEELERVERHVREAVGHERRMIWRYGQHLYVTRASLCAERGDLDRAAGYLADCLDFAERSGSRKYIAAAHRVGALVRVARGETGAAVSEVESAVALAREVGNPPQLWKALAVSARVHAAAGDADRARTDLAAAAATLERVAASLDPEGAAALRASTLAAQLTGGQSQPKR